LTADEEAKLYRSFWARTNTSVLSRTTSLPGSPSAGDIYIVPTADPGGDNIVFYYDDDWHALTPDEGWTAYVIDDEENVQFVGGEWTVFAAGDGGGGGGDTIELALFVSGKPSASEVVFRHDATAAYTLPAGLIGSQGSAGIAATASTVLTIKKDASTIGTATWAIAGTEPTLAMASDAVFAVGEVLSVTAPTPQDATLADISLSFLGTLS
jgi:hypothetical protein